MQPTDILSMRLANQHLLPPAFGNPCDAIAHLGAVQSQDYPGALWALALRTRSASFAELEAAFNAGGFVRTHVMRPTWHFVAATDIRWMLALTGPRIKRAMASRDRQLGIDDALVARSHTAVARALEGGQHLTRPELGAALVEAGIPVADGSVLAHLVSRAEIDSVICSGAIQGKVHTYALLDERVPVAPALSHEEAVAELVWRYFASHGPATLTDFAWWSGLTVADARAGISAHGDRFASAQFDRLTYWYDPSVAPRDMECGAYLLPNYDEYTVAYRERDLFYPRQVVYRPGPRDDVPFGHVIVIGGSVVGFWKRIAMKSGVGIEPLWFDAPSTGASRAFAEAAERYAAFLGLDLMLLPPRVG